MKKNLIVAAITAVSIASANTVLAANDSMYVGASYDKMKLKGNVGSGSKTYNSGNVTVRAGQNLTDNFGIEAVYGFNDNDSSNGGLSAYIKNYYGLYLTGELPVAQNFSLTSKLGYVRAKGELKGPLGTSSDSGSSVAWGVGGAYHLTHALDLTLDYASIYSEDFKLAGAKRDVKAQGFMFGAKFEF